jgi:hypothetical protein
MILLNRQLANLFCGPALDAISNTSVGTRQLVRMTFFILFCATLPGCMTSLVVEKAFTGEAQGMKGFVLTVNDDAYVIHRLWGSGGGTQSATVIIPRSALPDGCDAPRFFLNGSSNELQVARLAYTEWLTKEGKPPLPDEIYQPCALLISYGSFSELPESEGVFVTSVKGLVTTGKRQKPHPVAACALAPVGMMAEGYLMVGAVWALPVLLPTALIWEDNERQKKTKAKDKLPEPVAACWTATDGIKEKGEALDQPFTGFEWFPDRENSYVFITEEGVFSDAKPVSIDTRVRLSHGRVDFRPFAGSGPSLWTDADVECGLQAGDVVATFVELRK